jgi:hypothetical protein
MTIDEVDEEFAAGFAEQFAETGAPRTWPSTRRCGATTSC